MSALRLFALSSLALFAGPASAAVITQTTEIIYQGPENTRGNFGGTFDQFNSALGTLTGITITVTGGVNRTASFAPDSSCTSDCTSQVAFSTGFELTGPDIVYAPQFDEFYSISNFVHTFTDPNQVPISTFAPASFSETLNPLSDYIGTGIIDFDGFISEDSDFCADRGIQVACTVSGDITTVLVYSYNPISEP